MSNVKCARTMGVLYRRAPICISETRPTPEGGPFSLPFPGSDFCQMQECLGREKVQSRMLSCYIRLKVLCRDTPCRGTIFINVSRRKRTGCTFLHKVCSDQKGDFQVRRRKDGGRCDFYIPPLKGDRQMTICRTYVSTLTRVALRSKQASGCHLSLNKVTTPGRNTRQTAGGVGHPSTLRCFLGRRPRMARVRLYASGSFTKQ